jgi:hypothetical protein
MSHATQARSPPSGHENTCSVGGHHDIDIGASVHVFDLVDAHVGLDLTGHDSHCA